MRHPFFCPWPARQECARARQGGNDSQTLTVAGETKIAVFEAPRAVNGKECSLRFAFVWDESMPNNGYYEIVGLWSGIGEALYSGMADKGFQSLNPEGDRVSEPCS